jgi:hypothetical protein
VFNRSVLDNSFDKATAPQRSTGGGTGGRLFNIQRMDTFAKVRISTMGTIVDSLSDAVRRPRAPSRTALRIFLIKPGFRPRFSRVPFLSGGGPKHLVCRISILTLFSRFFQKKTALTPVSRCSNGRKTGRCSKIPQKSLFVAFIGSQGLRALPRHRKNILFSIFHYLA